MVVLMFLALTAETVILLALVLGIGVALIVWWSMRRMEKECEKECKKRSCYGTGNGTEDSGACADFRKFALEIFVVSFITSFLFVLIQYLCRA